MTRFSIRSLVLRLVLIAAGVTAFTEMTQAALADDVTQEKDVKAVKAFLAMFNKTWESGPTRITNKSIKAAYPNFRFYYVYSSPAARHADKDKTSQVLRLNKQGQVGYASPNEGLMKIGSIEEVKVAAAAIMSLGIGQDGPISVDANEVQVSSNDTNRVCKAVHDGCFFEVIFDRDSKYSSMSMVSRAKSDGGTHNDKHGKPTSKPEGAGKAKKMYYTVSKSANGATVVVLHNTPQGDVKCDEISADAMAKAAGVMAQKAGGGVVRIFHRDGKITDVTWDEQPVPVSPDATPAGGTNGHGSSEPGAESAPQSDENNRSVTAVSSDMLIMYSHVLVSRNASVQKDLGFTKDQEKRLREISDTYVKARQKLIDEQPPQPSIKALEAGTKKDFQLGKAALKQIEGVVTPRQLEALRTLAIRELTGRILANLDPAVLAAVDLTPEQNKTLKETPASVSRSLQGDWVVVGMEDGGYKATPQELQDMRWVIKGDIITAIDPDGSTFMMRYKIDPNASPRHFDITSLQGKLKGTTDPGIYALWEGRLLICCRSPDNSIGERPKAFTDAARVGSGYGIINLEKKGD
jgi:uncharacterized protein (TIGR03067 family)